MSIFGLTQRAAVTCCVCLAVFGIALAPAFAEGDPPTQTTSTVTTQAPPAVTTTAEGDDLVLKPSSSSWQLVLPTSSVAQLKARVKAERWLSGRIVLYQKNVMKWRAALGQEIRLLRLTPLKLQRMSLAALKHQAALWKHKAAKAHHQFKSIIGSRGYLPPVQAKILGKWLAAKMYDWTGSQWTCLDSLWGDHESSWYVRADNPKSEAYGIPQALPGRKMASVGSNWAHSAYVQIKWGLGYIKGKFKTPCGALSTRLSQGSY
jgi:hypothetical protein